MFEILPESHDNRIALKASGKLTHADYQNLTPLLETQIAKSGPISALMDMGDFAGMELRAGMTLTEVPVVMHARSGGVSMHAGGRSAYYAYKMALTLSLLPWRRRSPFRSSRAAPARAS